MSPFDDQREADPATIVPYQYPGLAKIRLIKRPPPDKDGVETDVYPGEIGYIKGVVKGIEGLIVADFPNGTVVLGREHYKRVVNLTKGKKMGRPKKRKAPDPPTELERYKLFVARIRAKLDGKLSRGGGIPPVGITSKWLRDKMEKYGV